MFLNRLFRWSLGPALILGLVPGCSSDPLDAADDVDDIPLSRKLTELKRGDAQALCAKRFVLFGGEGGSIQCDGEPRKNKLGTFDSCVQELESTKCKGYTVKDYRTCGEPTKGNGVCGFISPSSCVEFFVDCKIKSKSR